MDPRIVACVIFGAVSLILLGVMIIFVRRIVRLRRKGGRVDGQCVQVFERTYRGRRYRPVTFAIVAFTLSDGRRYRFEARTPRHTVGELIPVLVPLSHPEFARIDRPWQLWWESLFLGCLTVVSLLATAMVITGTVAARAAELPG